MKKKYITPGILVIHYHTRTSLLAGSVSDIHNNYYEGDEQLSNRRSIWDSANDSSEDGWQ